MKTVAVTGANRGIGLEFCRQYAEKGFNVFGLCRKASKELESINVNVIKGIDVTDPQSFEIAQKALADTKIDILINNAGMSMRSSLDDLDLDAIRKQFEVNALGPLRMTHSLLSNLQKDSVVAIISSSMGSIADNTSGGSYGYRMSKAALNMAGMSLSRDLASHGISVILLHPGYVKTDMTQHTGNVTPNVSVTALIKQIEQVQPDGRAHFRAFDGRELSF